MIACVRAADVSDTEPCQRLPVLVRQFQAAIFDLDRQSSGWRHALRILELFHAGKELLNVEAGSLDALKIGQHGGLVTQAGVRLRPRDVDVGERRVQFRRPVIVGDCPLVVLKAEVRQAPARVDDGEVLGTGVELLEEPEQLRVLGDRLCELATFEQRVCGLHDVVDRALGGCGGSRPLCRLGFLDVLDRDARSR